jgi:hypothetical protein
MQRAYPVSILFARTFSGLALVPSRRKRSETLLVLPRRVASASNHLSTAAGEFITRRTARPIPEALGLKEDPCAVERRHN